MNSKKEVALARFEEGNIFRSEGKLDQAINNYKEAIFLDPQNSIFHYQWHF